MASVKTATVMGSVQSAPDQHLLAPPIFPLAVAGLLLVVVLFALNLTVTEGSINGLLFYANVLSMSYTVQLKKGGS